MGFDNTPGTRGGPGDHDRRLAIQTYLIHTNPHFNVEAPLRAVGLEDLLSRLQFWPPGLIKAPIRAGVEKNEPVHQKTPRDTNCQKIPPHNCFSSPIVPSLTFFLEGSLGKNFQKGDNKYSHVQEADLDLNLDVEAANHF